MGLVEGVMPILRRGHKVLLSQVVERVLQELQTWIQGSYAPSEINWRANSHRRGFPTLSENIREQEKFRCSRYLCLALRYPKYTLVRRAKSDQVPVQWIKNNVKDLYLL